MRWRSGTEICTALLGLTLLQQCGACAAVDSRTLDLESFEAVWTTVRDRHFDATLGGLDWDAVGREVRPAIERATSKEQTRSILQAMLDRLRLSHFQIVPGEVLSDVAAADTAPGRQAQAGLEVGLLDRAAIVAGVSPDSPGARAGILPGDEVVRIGGLDVRGAVARLSKALAGRTDLQLAVRSAIGSRLSGIAGEEIEVEMENLKGARRIHRLVLEDPPDGWTYRVGLIHGIRLRLESRILADGTGLIGIGLFLDPIRLLPRVQASILKMADAPGIVIDLRGNTGGMMHVLTGVAGWFFGDGEHEFGTLITRGARLKALIHPRVNAYQGPVAVLVDGTTACAAEVFATGMKESGRARVFGTRTAGIALGGELERLPNGDGFMYASADFETRGGLRLEGNGLAPDVEAAPARRDLFEGRDPALEMALEWLWTQGRANAGFPQ